MKDLFGDSFNVNTEVVKKLSSITDEIASSLAPSGENGEASLFVTPLQYQNSISLRGTLNFLSQYNSLFEATSSENSSFGSDLGSWDGNWAMTDAAFEAENGVISPFKYLVKLGQDFSLDEEDDQTTKVANVLLTGSFQVKKSAATPVQVYESDVVLKIEKKATDIVASVTGSGENRYGHFKLFGTYKEETNTLHCFREYMRTGTVPKSRKPKRSATKRPRQNPATAVPPKKRERKTPPHLKDASSLFKKPKNLVSLKSNSKADMKAFKGMVDRLIDDDREKFFSQPVDPIKLNLPDYSQVITCPMDLGSILDKLAANKYDDMDEGVKDVRLTFQNAMLYNPKKHPVHTIAKMHLNHFERDLKSYVRQKERLEKQQIKKKALKAKQKEKLKQKKGTEKMLHMSKALEEQNKKFLKSKKKILEMFSSSEEEEESSESEAEVKPASKKKKKKSKTGEMEYMKNMMSMMSNQLEMMQQWQNTSLQEINRLNQELSGTKRQNKATMDVISANYTPPTVPPQAGVMPSYGNTTMMYDQAASPPTVPSPTKPKKVRPLTIAQMKQLSEDIHKLGPEDVMGLLEVVSGHGEIVAGGEEMELDIENMKPEVARACYKYVSKKISKAKNTADIRDLHFDDS